MNLSEPVRRKLIPMFGATVAAAAVACGSDAGPAAPAEPLETLRLPVRVHVLSSRLAPLDVRLSDAEVGALVDRANQVWAQADIVWDLESIVREPAESEDQFEQALLGTIPFTADLLAQTLPQGQRLPGGWDAFLVRDLTAAIGAPGIYISASRAAISSEIDPAGIDDPGRILAHELGHSLTLQHVACTAAGNLMAPNCSSQDRTRLTAPQIQAARAQAEEGRPSP